MSEVEILSNQIHHLKISDKYFADVYSGKKKAEIRFNDRNYMVGDILILQELINGCKYTGRSCVVTVTHILDDRDYLREGDVMLSITSNTPSKEEVMIDCAYCNGTSFVWAQDQYDDGTFSRSESEKPCPECNNQSEEE